jgi:hypothetical protein
VSAVLGVVGVSARVCVDQAVLEGAIDEDGELARRGGDRLGPAHADGDAAKERAERGLRARQVGGGQAENGGGAIRGGLRATTKTLKKIRETQFFLAKLACEVSTERLDREDFAGLQ